MAGILNLQIDQGATWTNTITVYEEDATTAINLTGYTVAAHMRKNYTSTNKHIITTTVQNPATLGKIVMSLTATQTAAITAGYYLYDIEITSAAGAVTRVMEGKIQMKPNVTR